MDRKEYKRQWMKRRHEALMARKLCVHCGKATPEEGKTCRKCRLRSKTWHAEHRERSKELKRSANGTEKAKSSVRNARYKRLYGISLEQYEEMLRLQGGVCAICKTHSKTTRLAVDHCHMTLKVRGLLCGFCNRGIGFFEGRPAAMMTGAIYLKRHMMS